MTSPIPLSQPTSLLSTSTSVQVQVPVQPPLLNPYQSGPFTYLSPAQPSSSPYNQPPPPSTLSFLNSQTFQSFHHSSPQAALQLSTLSTPAGGETDWEEIVKVLKGCIDFVQRSEDVLREIIGLESRVFELDEDIGKESSKRLEALHIEYKTLLETVQTLSKTHLFGALPLNFSKAHVPSNTMTDPTAQSNTISDPINQNPMATLEDLTSWVETKASLEFGRREAVRKASKAVVDVLRGGLIGSSR